jgi:hypothetical protein
MPKDPLFCLAGHSHSANLRLSESYHLYETCTNRRFSCLVRRFLFADRTTSPERTNLRQSQQVELSLSYPPGGGRTFQNTGFKHFRKLA